MAVNNIYTYRINHPLTLTSGGLSGTMYTDTIKVHKGMDDKVSFQVFDENRRAANISQLTLTLNVINANTGDQALLKVPTVTDGSLGKFDVVFSWTDTVNLDAGLYEFSITTVDANDEQGLAYVDTSQNAIGSIEIIEGVVPTPSNSAIVTRFVQNGARYESAAIDVQPTKNYQTNLHTCAVYGTNWAGSFYVEGSLDQSAPTNWFVVDLYPNDATADHLIFTPSVPHTGIDASNFRLSCNWLRFVYINDAGNAGTLDKVLHRS